MDIALKERAKNQIFKFGLAFGGKDINPYTLDFESQKYRQRDLAGLLRDSVEYFALTEDEFKELPHSELRRTAYTRISDAKSNSKGDYGELLLFLILDIFYDCPKFVTKARLRSTTADQIKGFDCAHYTVEDDELILWLGEAKFHQSFSTALSSAFNSIDNLFNDAGSVKSELKLLSGNIEINKNSGLKEKIRTETNGGKSLDKVNIKVPVLLTYDSKVLNNVEGSEEADLEHENLKAELRKELKRNAALIERKEWLNKKNINFEFFLFPFLEVKILKDVLEKIEEANKI